MHMGLLNGMSFHSGAPRLKRNWFLLAGVLLLTRLTAQTPNRLKIPLYHVRVETGVRVPMRDGVRLATDLYSPEGASERLPAILIRTPYDRKARTDAARFFAGHGYAVVIQDVRGKFDSEGHFTVAANEGPDGYDTLDWIAAQPWSTGKIGTYGCSYLGSNQIELAKLRNPHHAAMIPQAAGGAYRFDDVLDGGAFNLADNAPWFLKWGDKNNPAPQHPKVDIGNMLRTLPLIDMLRKAGNLHTDFEDYLTHEPEDPWWDRFGYVN